MGDKEYHGAVNIGATMKARYNAWQHRVSFCPVGCEMRCRDEPWVLSAARSCELRAHIVLWDAPVTRRRQAPLRCAAPTREQSVLCCDDGVGRVSRAAKALQHVNDSANSEIRVDVCRAGNRPWPVGKGPRDRVRHGGCCAAILLPKQSPCFGDTSKMRDFV